MKKIILIIVLLGSIFQLKSQNPDILKAMRDEIDRSMQDLEMESLEKPYYIEYLLRIREDHSVSGYLGSITDKNESQIARLSVDIRVGDYTFDNSNFFDVGLSFFGSSDDEERFKSRTVPYDLDYQTLRRELWLATDAAYKQSAEIFAKKNSALKNKMRKDTTPDFLEMDIKSSYKLKPYYPFDFKYFTDLIKSVSAVFAEYPEIHVSSSGVEYQPETFYYANSEGVEYIKTKFYTGFEIVAATQAEDGMNLADVFSAYAQNPNNLPDKDSLVHAARHLAENLMAQKNTDYVSDTYVGPVIFEDQAAGQIFAQIFAPNLVTQREPLTEGGMQTNDRNTAFQRKIGGRVLPEFLSIEDNPSKSMYEETHLLGTYAIDDEGVPAEQVNLVEKGYLKNLLSSRVPIKRVRKSNGHKRGGAPMFSNLIVDVADEEKAVDSDSLKQRLIELCKARELPYGIIIRKIIDQNVLFTTLYRTTYGNFRFPQGEGKFIISEAVKVFPDGREEIVRGLEGSGFTVQTFKDLILAGDTKYAMNILAPSVTSPFISGGDQYVGASIITPDILFEDAELRVIDADFNKPPYLNNPVALD